MCKGYCHKVLYWLGLGVDLFRTTHFMTLRPGDAKINHLGWTLKKKSQEWTTAHNSFFPYAHFSYDISILSMNLCQGPNFLAALESLQQLQNHDKLHDISLKCHINYLIIPEHKNILVCSKHLEGVDSWIDQGWKCTWSNSWTPTREMYLSRLPEFPFLSWLGHSTMSHQCGRSSHNRPLHLPTHATDRMPQAGTSP